MIEMSCLITTASSFSYLSLNLISLLSFSQSLIILIVRIFQEYSESDSFERSQNSLSLALED